MALLIKVPVTFSALSSLLPVSGMAVGLLIVVISTAINATIIFFVSRWLVNRLASSISRSNFRGASTLRVRCGDVRHLTRSVPHSNLIAIAKDVSGKNPDDFFTSWLKDPIMPDIPELKLYKQDNR